LLENKKSKILIVVGEASGDGHAAKLIKYLREMADKKQIELQFYGAVSHKLRAENVEEIVSADNFSVVGLLEIGKVLPMFWKAFQTLKKTAVERKTDVAILVDFPEFNLKLAKSLKKQGIKVIYYISPQLWAWRKYRKNTIKKYVDLLLTILPFEKDWYARHGIQNVEFVGNPTVDEVRPNISKEEFCRKHQLNADKPIVSLLPGSRKTEIERILPVLLETSALMVKKDPEIQFIILLAQTRHPEEAKKIISEMKNLELPEKILITKGETFDALNASNVAAVTSGTATLETGIIGTPMAIVYQISNLNYKLFKPLISVEHIGLINLIAEERLFTELIQEDFTAENLSNELFKLLKPETNQRLRNKLSEIKQKLGNGSATKKAAELIMKFLND
jgi:lipid-A-disaccharide synthase